MNNISVSVIVPTFNQDLFISNCINSILSQITNFKFEIIVGDDCSTDSTPKILKNFQKKTNNLKIFIWKKNEGGLKNIDKLLHKASGKYVVIIEGDDFWKDNYFLQDSINFLETKPNYSFVSSNYIILENQNYKKTPNYSGNISAHSLSLGNFIKMGSTVFHKKYYPKVNKYFIDLPLGDYPLLMSLLSIKKGYLRKKVSFVYRIHSKGIWSYKSKIQTSNLTILTINDMKKYFKKNYLFNFQTNYLTLKSYILLKKYNKIKFKTFIFGIICYLMIKIRNTNLRGNNDI